MQKLIFTLLFSQFVLSLPVYAVQKSIYGEDDRKNIFEAPSKWQELARSVAVMIPNQNIDTSGGQDLFPISTRPHYIENEVCKDEKFAEEPTAGYCSGFLVAPDLLVTAAHCVRFNDSLRQNRWVFDFGYFDEQDNLSKADPANVYRAVEIVEKKIDESGIDYSLVRLDREVKDRRPLSYRKSGVIGVGEPLAVIGGPSGLPLKFADSAFVRSVVKNIYFVSNTDTFTGNSGSPVFNAISGDVEGILVRGDSDYVWNKKQKCMRVALCEMTKCRGEDIVMIQNVKYLYQ